MLDDEELAIEDNYGESAGQTRLYSVRESRSSIPLVDLVESVCCL